MSIFFRPLRYTLDIDSEEDGITIIKTNVSNEELLRVIQNEIPDKSLLKKLYMSKKIKASHLNQPEALPIQNFDDILNELNDLEFADLKELLLE